MLYPIIRRVRRPLLPGEPGKPAAVVVVPPAVEVPSKAEPQQPSEQLPEMIPAASVPEQPAPPITAPTPLILAPEETPKTSVPAKVKRAKAADNK